MVRHFVLLVGIVLTVGLCRFAWAGPRLNYPHPQSNVCVPNVGGYGYFPTVWRQWPGEERQAQTNPRAINSERLPTPKGQELVPAPQATFEPEPPSPGLEGGILPPPMEPPVQTTLPGVLPEPPTEPEDEGMRDESEEEELPGLPGLPVEPGDSLLPPPAENGQPPEGSENMGGPEADPSTTPVPHETPDPPGTDRSSPGAWRDTIERPTSATAVLDQPDVEWPTGTMAAWEQPRTEQPRTEQPRTEQPRVESEPVVSPLECSQWPERSDTLLGAHRADAIGATVGASAVEVEPAGYTTVESAAEVEVSDQGMAVPPVALNGYCVVELLRNGRWTPGDLRWTVVHGGLIYRLSGDAQRRQFLANPDAFVPAHSGNDAVSLVDEHRAVPGQAAFCATYNGRLYMFSSAANQSQFNRDPRRYAAEE